MGGTMAGRRPRKPGSIPGHAVFGRAGQGLQRGAGAVLGILALGAVALGAITAASAAANGAACVQDDCSYPSIQAAFDAAKDGDVVTILGGVHAEGGVLRANGVTVRGARGAKLVDAAVRGKAALVLQGRDTVIEDIECSQSRVPSGNGACIRLEAENLTLRRVHFHNNETGLLSGKRTGLVVIEDSLIERNGFTGANLGQTHNIYVGGGELVIRRSRVLAARNEGHEVKSRAARTVIEESVIASLDSEDSRTIDIPNGGDVIVRKSVIHMGPQSVNWDMFAIGLERGRGHGQDHAQNSLVLEDNIIISDRAQGTQFLNLRDVQSKTIRNNTFVGGPPTRYLDQNFWYPTRAAAGFEPFPAIPNP